MSFAPAPGAQRDYSVGTNPQVVAVGDFNGDGIPDLAVADAGSNTVSILLGSGNGVFQAPQSFPTGSKPTSVLAADFDNDGKLDLVTTNYGDSAGSISFLKGNGDGTFQAPVNFPCGGTNPNFAVAGDFNKDGHMDVAVAVFAGNTSTSTTVSLLLGNGDGTFATPILLTAQRAPLWVAAADLNGDGKLDLVSANYGADSVSVFLGNGDGSFQAAVNYPAGSNAASVAIGDFNGDGIPDLAVADYGSGSGTTVSVLLGTGGGAFGAATTYTVGFGPVAVVAADLNGDGKLDLAVANWCSTPGNCDTGTTLSVLVGNGDGTFQAAQSITTGNGQVGVVAVDLNKDGLPDLAVPNYAASTVSVLINTTKPSTTHTLTVTPSGTGSGTVTSSPVGIICGATCSASYSSGTVVTLTATASAGSTFAGWSGGGCAGTGACTVTLSSDTTVVATFTPTQPTQFTLTVSAAGSGTGTVTSSPAGINCGSTCSAPFNSGSTVTLSAAAASGSTFSGWSGACSGTSTCVVTMSAATSVTATFTANPTFTLQVSKSGSGSGTVSSSPGGISCGGACSQSYAQGAVVTLTAAATSGSVFAGWSGGCSGTGTCTVTMNANQSVTADFESDFTLTLSRNGNGAGTVTSTPSGINCGSTCSATYGGGTSVTLAATPATGSTFTGWSGGGCSGTGVCTVTMNNSLSVSATFTLQRFTLSVSLQGLGIGSVDSSPAGISCGSNCSTTFDFGTVVTLTAQPGLLSGFEGWGGACSGGATSCTLTIGGNTAVTATFKLLGLL